MFSLYAASERARLFNWLTVILVAGWIMVVTVVVEKADYQQEVDQAAVNSFIETLLN